MLFVFMPFIEWETTWNMGVIDLIAILFYGLMFQKTCWLNMVHNWSNSFRFQWYRGITITLPWLFLILDKARLPWSESRSPPRRSTQIRPRHADATHARWRSSPSLGPLAPRRCLRPWILGGSLDLHWCNDMLRLFSFVLSLFSSYSL